MLLICKRGDTVLLYPPYNFLHFSPLFSRRKIFLQFSPQFSPFFTGIFSRKIFLQFSPQFSPFFYSGAFQNKPVSVPNYGSVVVSISEIEGVDAVWKVPSTCPGTILHLKKRAIIFSIFHHNFLKKIFAPFCTRIFSIFDKNFLEKICAHESKN